MNGYRWVLRPCGVVNYPNCTAQAGTANAMLCQADLYDTTTYNLAVYNPFVTQYTPIYYSSATGVRMYIQDGALCGSSPRITNIRFLCNTSATQASLFNVTESPQCTYNLWVWTNLVCPRQGVSCGGAGYDLTALTSSASDLSVLYNGYNWFFQPCGIVKSAACNGPTQETAGVSMMCQAELPPSTTTYDVAVWVPDDTTWTAINTNGTKGVQMVTQDGTTCGSDYFERKLTVNFLCDQNTTGIARLVSVTEVTICNYLAIVDTGRACSAIQASSSGGSSLSGGAIAGIVVGVVVGALLLLLIALAIFCGLCAGAGKKSTTYNNESKIKGGGGYGEMEPSTAEMSDVHTKEEETTH